MREASIATCATSGARKHISNDLGSKDHKRKIANSGPRVQQTTGPPVLHDLPGRLLSEALDEFSEGESTWIEEEEEEHEEEQEQRKEAKKEKKAKKRMEAVNPHDQDPPARRGGASRIWKEREGTKEPFRQDTKAQTTQERREEVGEIFKRMTRSHRAVSRLEGLPNGGVHMCAADYGCWCQCVLESNKQCSNSGIGLVAVGDTGGYYVVWLR